MAENLKVTHYRNGDQISHETDNIQWKYFHSGAYCNYNNSTGNVSIYGRLYNWYAVNDSRNIAPEGWHVPTDREWKQLEIYLGMSESEANHSDYRGNSEGGKLKEPGTSHWNSPNTGADNSSGFSGLPGGYRGAFNGYYANMGNGAYFWSTSQSNTSNAWYRYLNYKRSEIYRGYLFKICGFSVRCVRD